MDGSAKTSTHDATIRDRLSLCLRSKMETASEDTPRFSGHLQVSILVIMILKYSISRNNVDLATKEQAQRYTAEVILDLVLMEV
jgi:hypothetical protein